jgi:serine/threonine-protein kinase
VLVIGDRLGDFEVIREIGRGGMGAVYLANQVSLGRVVALKVLPGHLAGDPQTAARFAQEARSMAQLGHPNIAQVFSVGEEGGTHYFAMEYVEGESLASLIRSRGPLDVTLAVTLAAQVADALAHAHHAGIIHRDIKPSNIMVDRAGDAVVTDFGIAKVRGGAGLTEHGTSIGTPDYMSPELVKGDPIDGRSDLYSLGIVLYEAITGRAPYSAPTPMAVAMKHVNEPLPSVRLLTPHCPEAAEAVITRLTEKQPNRRFATADEAAAALRASLTAVPSPTSPRSKRRGPRRVGVRRRTTVLVLLLGVLAATVAVAYLLWRGSTKPPDGPPLPTVADVPSVIGKSKTEAETALWLSGSFRIIWNAERYDDRYPEGVVCSQKPDPGTEQQRGDAVYLVLSRGPEPLATVPNVVGRSEDEAATAVTDKGLTMSVSTHRTDAVVPSGHVCAQKPEGGDSVAPGSTVFVVLSSGPEPIAEKPVGTSVRQRLLGSWIRTTSSEHFERARFIFRDDGSYLLDELNSSYEERGTFGVEETEGGAVLIVDLGKGPAQYDLQISDAGTWMRIDRYKKGAHIWSEWRRE